VICNYIKCVVDVIGEKRLHAPGIGSFLIILGLEFLEVVQRHKYLFIYKLLYVSGWTLLVGE
jgi:hypothetical protein